MRQGKSLTEMATELERQKEAKADYIADTRELTLLTQQDGGSELSIKNVGEFGVTEHTHSQIGDRLSIPKKFYRRLAADHPGLLDTNVNTLFRENPERRMVRTLDERARAFLSDRYRRLDNAELAEVLIPILGEIEGVEFLSCELTDRRMYIKALAPKVEGEVKVGDPVQAGVVVANSEVGSGSLSVTPLVYRLFCLNGMILPDLATRKYHVGRQVDYEEEARQLYRDETLAADDRAFFLKMGDMVKAAVDQTNFNAIVQRLRDTTEQSITGDPVQAVERLTDKLSLTEHERGSVLRHLVEGADLSQWGVLNAVTRASQDVEDYDRATDMERMGGTVMAMEPKEFAALVA